jgi:exonuclease VII small subunit
VAGTAAVALHASRRLYELVDGIVNGPTELVAMRRDTNELFNILASLETIVRDKESKEDKDISDVMQRLNQPLDNCMETLKALETLIQKSVKPTGQLRKSRWRTFASTFREKELKGLIDQLTNGKLTLELALTTINTYVAVMNQSFEH